MPLFVMKNSSLNRASSPVTMALALRNLAGEVARKMPRYFWAPAPPEFDASRTLACHANSERSFVFFANFLLQPSKRLLAFTIQYRHRHAKDSQQAICNILHPCRPPIRGPRHPPHNRDIRQDSTITENLAVNPRNRLQRPAQAILRPAQRPPLITELRHLQRNQLLQPSPSRKPLARRELGHQL
jgi:hypothetical protein